MRRLPKSRGDARNDSPDCHPHRGVSRPQTEREVVTFQAYHGCRWSARPGSTPRVTFCVPSKTVGAGREGRRSLIPEPFRSRMYCGSFLTKVRSPCLVSSQRWVLTRRESSTCCEISTTSVSLRLSHGTEGTSSR